MPLPSPTASCAKPFSLLSRLLHQGQQGHLAAAELPQLDVPLPQGGRVGAEAAAPSSLRRELERLAADDDSSLVTEAAEAVAGGFVGLRSMDTPLEQLAEESTSGSVVHATALLSRFAAAPAPVRLEEQPQAAALPSFLLPPPHASAAAADPAATKPGSTQQLFLLEPLVLPAAGAVRGSTLVAGAPTSAFGHLFQPVPVPAAPAGDAAWCFVPEGCQPVSLATLMAQDLILDDSGGLMLPPVQVEEPGEADSPGGCWAAGTSALSCIMNRSIIAVELPVLGCVVLLSMQKCPCSTVHAVLSMKTTTTMLTCPAPTSPAPQPLRCCRSFSRSADASPPTPPTWRCTSTGGWPGGIASEGVKVMRRTTRG